ncbi:MAG: protein kinase, partial [Candidatus Competibacter denitrificans]
MHIPGYQIERELGQGGMALVYLAMQESLDRHVALKIIKPVLTADADFAPRFLREGRIIAQLNDSHIVTVYDIGSHDGVYYLSMEYLPGGTLHQRIRDGLPLHDALSVTRAIASALHYAHRRNIIHRDIKPQNILFRENGSPVLTDFGIAKTLGGSTIMTRTGLSIGTPRYMSPEQIRGQAVDGRADLYSLGVLFYEMMAGDVPFAAEDSFALAMMHVTAPIPELPTELARFQPFLSKLLEKDPANRFQSGEDVIAALDAIEPPTGYTGVRPALLINSGPSAVPVQRPRWRRALPLAAAFAGVVAAGGYALLNRSTPPDVSPPTATSTPADTPAKQRAEADQLLAQATQQQAAGALADSLARIDQGLRLVPDHAALLALRQHVSGQLADMEKTRQAQERDQPPKPDAETFLTEARRARQEGALDSSLAHIERGLLALPQHSDLLALKREVQEQQARQRSQQELETRQQALAAEQRKLESARLRAQAEQQRQLEAQLRAQIEEQRQAEARLRAQAEELQRKAEQERRRAQIEEQRRVEAQRRAEAEA